ASEVLYFRECPQTGNWYEITATDFERCSRPFPGVGCPYRLFCSGCFLSGKWIFRRPRIAGCYTWHCSGTGTSEKGRVTPQVNGLLRQAVLSCPEFFWKTPGTAKYVVT